MLEREEWRATAGGFALTLVVLGAIALVAGPRRIVTALSGARPAVVLAMVGVALVWQLSWGLALRTVLGILGNRISVPLSFFVFNAATFANNVTPFGQAGGEPITALLVSKVGDCEYETGLASIASVDALNFVPSIALGSVGIAYFAATITLGRRLEIAALALGTMAVALPVGAVLGWRYRYAVERKAIAVVTPLIRWITRVVPRLSPPTPEALAARVENFFGTIERIATDRRGLLVALAFSAAGWLLQMGCLWLAALALGYGDALSVAAILVVVPLGAVAGVTPLPGGAGGIEAIIASVLVATTGIGVVGASAIALLHRSVIYWVPLSIGGVSASYFGATRLRP